MWTGPLAGLLRLLLSRKVQRMVDLEATTFAGLAAGDAHDASMGDARDLLLGKVIAYYAAHGVRDTSLRRLAAEIGRRFQRMLHYHFGSREDLLAAVIDAIAGSQAAQMADLLDDVPDPLEAGRRNWEATAEGALGLGALWFELATHAMHGEPHAAARGGHGRLPAARLHRRLRRPHRPPARRAPGPG